ncbi:MAG: L,D-transpeptidase [Phreatobacter sp.]|uniref:L,D-transpeptidase n=1 Tax=Phreatobacter sp. TaxID=1966341 RepID=UPI002732F240|nr:L,D-transpeptidase [Phreatobacter sp.]MDP2801825.1 L,D-transpeptidase [Phreatobacter sp.]
MTIDRRFFVLGAPFILGACTTRREELVLETPRFDPYYVAMYAEVQGEPHPVPAIDLSKVDERWWRREVAYRGRENPGTIVVDPDARYAYLVLEGSRAMRYGVGVGKEEGFNLTGIASIGRKAAWPRWTPTRDMIRREPERYGPVAAGMPGGADNPLGPRALYLYRGNRDTLYRLHGTTEPWTIGTQVSSGCIRFLNQDIIDLFGRVPVGSTAIVLPSGQSVTS